MDSWYNSIGDRMKKLKILLAIVLMGCLVGCASNEEKVAVDTNKVTDVLTANGFAVVDDSAKYKNESYVLKSITGKYGNAEIAFIEYSSADTAEKVLEEQIEKFSLRKSTGASTTNKKGKNFHKYILISNNYYMRSVRVENTLIFCNLPLSNKDLVEKLFNAIAY